MYDEVVICFVVFIFYFWWVVNYMIYVVRCGMYVMVIYMFNNNVIWYIEFNIMINRNICFFYCISLWDSMREVI